MTVSSSPEVPQAAARHPTHHTQPMQSAAGIRRGVGDAALAVEHHHAIADAGLAELAHPLNPVVGEGAVRDHLGEPGIQTAVDGLQRVLVADGSRSRLAGQNRDRQVPAAHGHVVHHAETVAQRQAALLLHDCVVSDPGAVADLVDLRPSPASSVAIAVRSATRRPSLRTTVPTGSTAWTVGPVDARAWASTMKPSPSPPPVPPVGTRGPTAVPPAATGSATAPPPGA